MNDDQKLEELRYEKEQEIDDLKEKLEQLQNEKDFEI